MAGVALILGYQWRAYWRRVIRTHQRAQFYLTMLALLGGTFVFVLPSMLSRSAQELAAGQTTSMDAVLWGFCVLWVLVVAEDSSISLTSRRLRTFPIGVRSLLGVRMLSLFCSPVSLLIAAGSLMSLWPFLFARHGVLGGAAALWLHALSLGLGMSLSHMLSVAELRRKLFVFATVVVIALVALRFVLGAEVGERPAGMAFAPPHLVSALAVASSPSAMLTPLIALLAVSVAVCYVLLWSFRRSLLGETTERAEGRAIGATLWFPGRFGGLVRKEQLYFRKIVDVWLGLLLALAVGVASLFGPLPPVIRQATILIVFAANVNIIMNCFGVDTTSELNRYSILPLRGREVLFIKNVGLAVIIVAQLAVLLVIAAWRSGPVAAGVETMEVAVLLLSHLAWGNIVSVDAPSRMQFYQLSSGNAPITALVGVTIGSAPAVALLFLLHSGPPLSAVWMVVIVLLAIAAYLLSLHYAGRNFERRRHIIGERLS